jgi:signal transduction histidine kinase
VLILEEDARREVTRYGPGMQRPGQLTRRYVFDLAIALLATVAMVELVIRRGAPNAPQTTLWFALPAITVLVLAIVARRRFPFLGPAAYWLLAAGISFVDWSLLPFAVSLFAVGMAVAFLLGNLPDARQSGIGLAVVLVGAATIVYRIPGHSAAELVFIPLEFAISWLAGFVLRESAVRADAAEELAARLERERERDALRAVVEERTRIARELHDIVGHSLSVMTVQTSGVRRLLRPEQEQEREALVAVERTGREALAEMRRVVGALRDREEAPTLAPQPSLSRVDKLVAQARETGLPVDLEIEGEPLPLPAGVDLTAYRLVQEGLTNAIRHAAARHADVRVRYDGDHVEIEVCDDGRGTDGVDPASSGGGHGLVGIRERVSIYGGELEAGPRAGGGFRLRARLPVAT